MLDERVQLGHVVDQDVEVATGPGEGGTAKGFGGVHRHSIEDVGETLRLKELGFGKGGASDR